MENTQRNVRREIAPWTLQVLLCALFLFAGAMKLITPSDVLAQQCPLPVGFMRFIGVAEALGALGLVLPGLFRVARGLTSLAAAGLVIIMIGATVISLPMGAGAVVPCLVGIACGFIAVRRRPAGFARRQQLQAAH